MLRFITWKQKFDFLANHDLNAPCPSPLRHLSLICCFFFLVIAFSSTMADGDPKQSVRVVVRFRPYMGIAHVETQAAKDAAPVAPAAAGASSPIMKKPGENKSDKLWFTNSEPLMWDFSAEGRSVMILPELAAQLGLPTSAEQRTFVFDRVFGPEASQVCCWLLFSATQACVCRLTCSKTSLSGQWKMC